MLPREEKEKKEEREFLDKMRGWPMTVGTLFVGKAFQAAMHPPEWMPKTQEWSRVMMSDKRLRALSHDERRLIHRFVVWSVTRLVAAISLCVAGNFIVGVTDYGAATAVFSILMAVYALAAASACVSLATFPLTSVPPGGQQGHSM